jgi:esterase/lipase superfamily enzyme
VIPLAGHMSMTGQKGIRWISLALLCVSLSACATIGDMTSGASDMFSSEPAARPKTVQMFIVSTRKDGDAGAEGGAKYTLSQISVPSSHVAGVIEAPTFGKPNPQKHFAVIDNASLSGDRFRKELATHISGRVGSSRDVLLYVHGFNTSLDEARFRLSQIVYDGRFSGVPVLFSWPSKSNLFSYVSDKDSATSSRDALEKVLLDLSTLPDVGRIHILAHSMGSWLAMEALRENAIAGHPDLDGRLGDVMLAAPDLDLNVFKQQMARLDGHARVSVFVSHADRALSLSSSLAGDRPRVGALDPNKPHDRAELDRLGVRVYDMSSFSGGIIGHGVYADAPDVIRTIGAHLAQPRKEDANTVAVIHGDDDTPAAAQSAQPQAIAGDNAKATSSLAPMAAPPQ